MFRRLLLQSRKAELRDYNLFVGNLQISILHRGICQMIQNSAKRLHCFKKAYETTKSSLFSVSNYMMGLWRHTLEYRNILDGPTIQLAKFVIMHGMMTQNSHIFSKYGLSAN